MLPANLLVAELFQYSQESKTLKTKKELFVCEEDGFRRVVQAMSGD
jgi:hypothetical protein